MHQMGLSSGAASLWRRLVAQSAWSFVVLVLLFSWPHSVSAQAGGAGYAILLEGVLENHILHIASFYLCA
jgi:hypothetical protein